MIRHTDGGMKLPTVSRAVATKSAGKIDNAKVVQTCAMPEEIPTLVPARSLFDRAHEQRGIDGFLVPAARKVGRVVRSTVQHSNPRLYPSYYCSTTGNTFEDCCDWLYEARRRLNGVAGIGLRSQPTAAEQVQTYLTRLSGDVGSSAARDMTRRRV